MGGCGWDEPAMDLLIDTLREHDWRGDDDNSVFEITRKISDRTPAMLVYSRKLTLDPQGVTEDDREALRRDSGLKDVEMLDLVQVISYFNYVNRVVAGLDVKLGVAEGAP